MMKTAQLILEVFIDLTFVGLVAAIIMLVRSAINLKNAAVNGAKQLYLPPTKSVQALVSTAKGIGTREAARGKRVVGTVRSSSNTVGLNTASVKRTIQNIPWHDTKAILTSVRNVLNLVNTAVKIFKSTSDHNKPNHSTPAGTSGTT